MARTGSRVTSGDAQRRHKSHFLCPHPTRCKPLNRLSRRVLHELKSIFMISGPLVLIQLLRFTLVLVSLAFCGQLGKQELSAASLAISLVSVTAITVGIGMTGACDTLLNQCSGSQNKRRVGIIVQRGILILSVTCLIVWAIQLNTRNLLLLIGQDAEVARLAGEYVDWYMASVWFYFVYTILCAYLQTQSILMPLVLISVAVNVLNAVFHYELVMVAKMGIKGAAISVALSYFLLTAFTVIYVGLKRRQFDSTTTNRHCLQEWGQFTYLAVLSMLMQGIEMWSFEAGVFLSATVGQVELGAQSIVFQLSSLCFFMALGISIASSIRIGQFLGANDWQAAQFCSRVAFVLALIGGVLVGLLEIALRWYIPVIYTEDSEVQAMAADVMLFNGDMRFVDYSVVVGTGVLRGCGQQAFGVLFNVVGYFLIGLPLGISLLHLTPLTVEGFWIGMVACMVVQMLMFFTFIWRIDWQQQAELAQVRAAVLPAKLQADGDDCVSQSVDKYTVHELPVSVVVRRRLLAVMIALAIFGTGLVLRLTLKLGAVEHSTPNTTVCSSLPALSSPINLPLHATLGEVYLLN